MPAPRRFLLWVTAFNLGAIGLALLLSDSKRELKAHFDEGGYVTWLSAAQLFLIGILAFDVARRRRPPPGERRFFASYRLWTLAAAGFLFLGFDELKEWHEKIDAWLHHTFEKEETALSDRLDDLIVVGYGAIGIAVLFASRRELRAFRGGGRYLAAAFALALLMIALDFLTNRKDVVPELLGGDLTKAESRRIRVGLKVAEDSAKLLAVGVFLSAFYFCRWTAVRITPVGPPPPEGAPGPPARPAGRRPISPRP